MPSPNPDHLRPINSFPQLVKYLRDELEWPIESDDFDELTFDYEPEELGLDAKAAVKIKQIKQLRPLADNQPWGIFFINFEPKRLPVVALRRILRSLVVKKRQSANRPQQAAWQLHDLLFISSYGEADHRDITFAHFSEDTSAADGSLPTLRVLGWDDEDTVLHLAHAHMTLRDKLRWPQNEFDLDAWRSLWSSAFTLRHREVINTSKALAVRMAELASAIRKRANRVLSVESEKGPLRKLMSAFKEALIHDLSDDDFADMYAQTITYGLLTARVSRPAGLVADNVADMVPITNPFLKELMETFLNIGGRRNGSKRESGIDFDELGVNDVVDTLRAANMEAVLRDFGDKNPQEDPVIHFYEDFLKEYDAKKRMQRGVFYTPRPVVSFIVRSVDELLRTEFGLEDGLADTTTWGEMVKRFPPSPSQGEGRGEGLRLPEIEVRNPKTNKIEKKPIDPATPFVQILDPATGTGTFLVEVIGLIHKTMTEKWRAEGHGAKKIEQLWNDYVPKHLLPRLHGYELMMAPYAIAHMKIGLKLYETGYRFASEERARVYLTNALEPAQDFSGTLAFAIPALAHEAEAVNAIKRAQRFTVVIGNPPYSVVSQNSGVWISELMRIYKRAVREERNIQPLSDDYVKFLRLGHFLVARAGFGVLSLITNHTYLTGIIHRGLREQLLASFDAINVLDLHGSALLGLKSPTGHTDQNVFDIQQGVSIAALVRRGGHGAFGRLRRVDLWGLRDHKYQVLAGELPLPKLTAIVSRSPFFFFAASTPADEAYEKGVSVADLFELSSAGFVTGRDEALISFEREPLVALVEDLASRRLSDDDIASRYNIEDTSGWPVARRRRNVAGDAHRTKKIIPAAYRPFDDRFTFYCSFLQRARYSVFRHLLEDNIALITSRLVKGEEPAHFFVSRLPVEKIFLSPKTSNNAFVFPLYYYPQGQQLGGLAARRPAINGKCAEQIAGMLGLAWRDSRCGESVDDSVLQPEELLRYVYGVFFSPTYRIRYAEPLRTGFPHIPLPGGLDLFRTLAHSGDELVALHLMESPKLDDHIASLVGSGDFQVEKVSYSDETVWIDKAKTRGFRGVPEEVWNFHIGGYQVCEKWLKDRQAKGGKNPRPGRVLTDKDIDHYQRIVVALSETIRIMAEIDEVIDAHGGWPDAFVTGPD